MFSPAALWPAVTVVSPFKCFTASVDCTRERELERAHAYMDRFNGEKSTVEGVLRKDGASVTFIARSVSLFRTEKRVGATRMARILGPRKHE